MTKEQLQTLKNFSEKEKDAYGRFAFGDCEEIDFEFMIRVDNMVSYAKCFYRTVFLIHDINLGEHSKESYHKKGLAIDGSFKNVPLFEQVLIATKFCFKGIGFYPYWGEPGIHADDRRGQVTMWLRNKEGEYIYLLNRIAEELKMGGKDV